MTIPELQAAYRRRLARCELLVAVLSVAVISVASWLAPVWVLSP